MNQVCQLCDKKAIVHLTEISNGQQIERHLCQQCAQKEGITVKAHEPISKLLHDLVEAQEESHKLKELHCPQCDLSWSDFRKRGLLGCSNDYLAFGKTLETLIERTQGSGVTHVGRIPKCARGNLGRQVQLLRLRQDLQTAVESEDYEAAARLRDEIRKNSLN